MSIHREQHRHLSLGEFYRRWKGWLSQNWIHWARAQLGVGCRDRGQVQVDDHVLNLREINLARVVVNFLADQLRELVPVGGVAKMDLYIVRHTGWRTGWRRVGSSVRRPGPPDSELLSICFRSRYASAKFVTFTKLLRSP